MREIAFDMISSEKELSWFNYYNVRYFAATNLGQSSVLGSTPQNPARSEDSQNQTWKDLSDKLLQWTLICRLGTVGLCLD